MKMSTSTESSFKTALTGFDKKFSFGQFEHSRVKELLMCFTYWTDSQKILSMNMKKSSNICHKTLMAAFCLHSFFTPR